MAWKLTMKLWTRAEVPRIQPTNVIPIIKGNKILKQRKSLIYSDPASDRVAKVISKSSPLEVKLSNEGKDKAFEAFWHFELLP